MSDKTFHVKIRNTDKVIFEGAADRISSYNEIGPFDVYRMHANFISIIKKELILYNNRQKIQEVKFEQAIMKVKQDKAISSYDSASSFILFRA